ncbi:WhiB family transcriptional regulator [Nocardioides sp. InS609-2]|uniref:WhiB family transcriptional regulator n=1 Tax=Nocardioides sp. InS609-2 TaxID=2760705 RepID=UPI0020BD5483|nr:WhiB family transcriptional regulator [Nocardioides sp. InS609-2]
MADDSPVDLQTAFRWDTQPWADNALCASTDPEAFFPEKGGPTREAKSVCTRCTVAAECLDWALEHNERFGIWGGLSERERRRLATSSNTSQEAS